MLLLLSCEKKDYSPHISPNWFTLSDKNAEVHVEVDPDCEMWGFNMDESPMYPITEEMKEKSMSIQPIDEHHQATIYCKEDQVEKIDFGVMTIEKEGKASTKSYSLLKTVCPFHNLSPAVSCQPKEEPI